MIYLPYDVEDFSSSLGKKGGSLLTAIHSYMQHGDPYVKALVKHILNQVAEPIKIILSRWIYEGELDDAFNEVCTVQVIMP